MKCHECAFCGCMCKLRALKKHSFVPKTMCVSHFFAYITTLILISKLASVISTKQILHHRQQNSNSDTQNQRYLFLFYLFFWFPFFLFYERKKYFFRSFVLPFFEIQLQMVLCVTVKQSCNSTCHFDKHNPKLCFINKKLQTQKNLKKSKKKRNYFEKQSKKKKKK